MPNKTLKDLWDANSSEKSQDEMRDRIWLNFKKGIALSNTKVKFLRITFIAASLAACLLIGAMITKVATPNNSTNDAESNECVILANNAELHILPDGSKVWMDRGSELHYSESFANNRRVFLKGNAVFEVFHQTDSAPFYVDLKNSFIKVTGTCFTVMQNNTEGISVTLHNGKVDFVLSDRRNKVSLTPNQQAEYNFNDSTLSVKNFFKEITWESGAYKLKNATIEEFVKFMDWKYGVKVNAGCLGKKQVNLNGIIQYDDSIDEILKKICYILGVSYYFDKDQYILIKNT